MAKIRTVKKEVTIHAEKRGHGLFLWKPDARPVERFDTVCARCGEEFSVRGVHKCEVAGPVSAPCGGGGGIAFVPAKQAPDPEENDDLVIEDLCGDGCAQKRLARWLDELKATSTTTK